MSKRPRRNHSPAFKAIRQQILTLALEETELPPRELAVRFTDTAGYFVSEATVYRLLKAHDLIASPAFIVMKAASEFTDKTTRPNEMWQGYDEVNPASRPFPTARRRVHSIRSIACSGSNARMRCG